MKICLSFLISSLWLAAGAIPAEGMAANPTTASATQAAEESATDPEAQGSGIPEGIDESEDFTQLDELVVTNRNGSTLKLRRGASNSELITRAEINRAACCNLGESFTTNPSVDVNYSDAATGARQIKLLGLPGTYVQMLTENVPDLRGASALYGLGYVPGPWMQSIQVSKGASSVKNGYESLTGQINIEYLKPQTSPSLSINAYADYMGKVEANAAGNLHLSDKWSGALLLHGENSFAAHDANDDGFADTPKVRQLSALNRWAYFSDNYIFQIAAEFLDERRDGGQIVNHGSGHTHSDPYLIDIDTRRVGAFMKNAYIFDQEHGSNVALILSGSWHDQHSSYGRKEYDVIQRNLYASLLYETNFTDLHSLSAGLSVNADAYNQHYRLEQLASLPLERLKENEVVPGAYAQYTFNSDDRLILMGGVRYDWSSRYGSMFTPRLHARWNISDPISIHLSAGKGYRTPYALADNSWLLASARQIVIEPDLAQEEGWNFGGGASGNFSIGEGKFDWSAEYYFTRFRNQTVVDLESNPYVAYVRNIHGRSYSHSAQVEVGYHPISELGITAAYRFNDVRVDYGHGMQQKPLTSKSKALFSVNYAPMMGLWQFDVTLAVTGGGRMPTPKLDASGDPLWNATYKAYPTLNAQVTRNFRHWAVYIGGENLTNYRQSNPVIGAADPWGPNFDATMTYGPLQGAMVYVGFRYNLTKY